eukprot:TRINITY_DN381_c0_g1_i2.p1 TRINITY_DN381_c0_g1~~TRINITY_DN381_c0_g1_i2.p1  ORF type:complete len:193 (+),score=82.06 TRINITY_DN381_c0_g1_i2:609-1187(+)
MCISSSVIEFVVCHILRSFFLFSKTVTKNPEKKILFSFHSFSFFLQSIQSEKVAKASADVERAMHMREKIDNEVQESSAEIKVALEARLALAESNRVEQISKIQEKAANKVKQALFVYETVKEKEASEKQSKLESIDAKLANAEEKRNENISNIQGKASAEVAKALEIAAMPKDEKENEDIVMEPDFEIERD